MAKDVALVALSSLAFGLLVTTHFLLCLAIGAKRPRYRALIALFVPPLAPYWGFVGKRRVLSAAWLGALFVYILALAVSARS